MVPFGLQNLSLIGRFLCYVLNSESPVREVPLYMKYDFYFMKVPSHINDIIMYNYVYSVGSHTVCTPTRCMYFRQ